MSGVRDSRIGEGVLKVLDVDAAGLIGIGGFRLGGLVVVPGPVSGEGVEAVLGAGDVPVFTVVAVAGDDGSGVFVCLSDGVRRAWVEMVSSTAPPPEPPPPPPLPVGGVWKVVDTETWTAAATQAQPGDTVDITAPLPGLLTWSTSGTANKPILIRTTGDGQLTGSPTNPNGVGMLDVTAKHVNIDVLGVGTTTHENTNAVVRFLGAGGSGGHRVSVAIDAWDVPRTAFTMKKNPGTGEPTRFVDADIVVRAGTGPKLNPQFGEAVYCGSGLNEWEGGATDATIRVWADKLTAEAVEIKPNCDRIEVALVEVLEAVLTGSPTQPEIVPTGLVVAGWANSPPPAGQIHPSVGAGHRIGQVRADSYSHAGGGLGPGKSWKYPPVVAGVGGVEIVGPIDVAESDTDCLVQVGSPAFVGPPVEIGAGVKVAVCTRWGGVVEGGGPLPDPFTEVYYTDFSGGLGGWDVYDSPGHGGTGWRRPKAITAGDGGAEITASMGDDGLIVSGGMKLVGHSQRFGRWTVRCRADRDPTDHMSMVALLWPVPWDNWPEGGEVNIAETWSSRVTRSPVEANLHWVDTHGVHRQEGLTAGVDGSEWQTYVVEWTPGLVRWSAGGGGWQEFTGREPVGLVDLCVQLDAFPPHKGEVGRLGVPVVMGVEWVRVEAYTPR